jgi:hypothetical protein
MIKLTQHSLDKLEDLLKMAGYTVRNEKGNFKSGSCVIQSSKTIVLNKFAPTEAKVMYLIEVLHDLQVDESLLDEKNLKFLQQIRETPVEGAEAASAADDASANTAEELKSPE